MICVCKQVIYDSQLLTLLFQYVFQDANNI